MKASCHIFGVTVGGNEGWALRVGAYATGRVNPSDWLRYAIVVLNWNDGGSGPWNPQPVSTTIEFRGMQAKYTFPVGVTTLWWYAPKQSNSAEVIPEAAHVNITEPIAATVPATNSTAAIPSYTATVSFASAPTKVTESPAIRIRGTNWFGN